MNIGFAIFPVLLLLGPGLFFYIGLYHVSGAHEFRPAPPSPGSFVTFGTVILGTILTHWLFASAFELNELIIAKGFVYFTFPYNPNFYSYMAAFLRTGIKQGIDIPSTHAFLYVLTCMIIQCSTAIFIGKKLADTLSKSSWFRRFFYGWCDDFLSKSIEPNSFPAAFVLTNQKVGDGFIGYEGVVHDIILDNSKKLEAIVLLYVERFIVERDASTIRRKYPAVRGDQNDPPRLIESIYLDAEHIFNVSITVYKVED